MTISAKDGHARGRDRGSAFLFGAAVLVGVILLCPSEGWALQMHGGVEGLYAHQFGHVLFFAAMIVFYYRLRRQAQLTSRGWRHVTVACLLFALWNVAAFTGHWLEEALPAPIFGGGTLPWERELAATADWKAYVLYACKLDHLLAVPAMLFFLSGLRCFLKERQ